MQLPDFNASKLVIAGDVMLDRYWRGPCERVSPEAPVPIVRVGSDEAHPGGAANVAVNAAHLGATVSLVGVTGCDDAAAQLAAALTAQGVEHSLLARPAATTVTKLRVLSQNQQLLRLDFESDFSGLSGTEFNNAVTARLRGAGALVLSDYAKGTLDDPQALIAQTRAHAYALRNSAGTGAVLPLLVDPKGANFDRYRGATLLTPNFAEFQAAAGRCSDDAELEQRANALIARLQLDALLITRSERGVSLLRRDAPALHLPAQAREVYDVTGAGDTVLACLAAALAAGATLADATALANAAAGLVVGKLGTASVSAAELRHLLESPPSSQEPLPTGIVNQQQLAELADAARQRGEKLVMTNGCFDILHAGHVSYLARSKQLGQRLIVAVNDDASVRRLKGPARPLNPLAQRQQVLAALAAIDWVVDFSEDTPERLICALRPEVLVKGDDYRADATSGEPGYIGGADCVRRAGGEVVTLALVPGQSSSTIIRRAASQPDDDGAAQTD